MCAQPTRISLRIAADAVAARRVVPGCEPRGLRAVVLTARAISPDVEAHEYSSASSVLGRVKDGWAQTLSSSTRGGCWKQRSDPVEERAEIRERVAVPLAEVAAVKRCNERLVVEDTQLLRVGTHGRRIP